MLNNIEMEEFIEYIKKDLLSFYPGSKNLWQKIITAYNNTNIIFLRNYDLKSDIKMFIYGENFDQSLVITDINGIINIYLLRDFLLENNIMFDGLYKYNYEYRKDICEDNYFVESFVDYDNKYYTYVYTKDGRKIIEHSECSEIINGKYMITKLKCELGNGTTITDPNINIYSLEGDFLKSYEKGTLTNLILTDLILTDLILTDLILTDLILTNLILTNFNIN